MNWSKTTLALALAACLGLAPAPAKSRTGDETFAIGDRKFLLNGRPFLIKAAEIHYARIPSDYWEHRIEMCKALGMNTICIYTFWNFHEQQPGQFNFKGDHDVARFCRLVQKHGMYVILRPGPYACAEWEMGGLPWWLLKKQDVRLRSTDPYFLERVKIYMDRMGEELADLQITRGGNIIMVQVENEFGAYGEDKPYVSAVRDIVRGAGFTDVPLFQCDWSSTFKRNGLDDLVWTINFGTGANIDAQFAALKKARPHTPLMCSEFWSGWFDHWGRKHETRDATAMVQGIDDMLQRGISFSLYMAHGGTTFGHWGGANCPPYSAMCSSYDYDAPISEAGWATPKYHKLRALLEQYADSGQVIPDIPAPMPVISLPAFTVDEAAPLFDNLPEPKHSDDVRPMEQYDQGWGSILYRTRLPEVKEGTVLEITEPHDWTQVYADGRLLGRLDRRHGETSIVLPALPAGTRLDILVEAMGRVNFDVAIHDRKGITEKVELVDGDARQALRGWDVYNLPVDYRFAKKKDYAPISQTPDGPAYYRATFDVEQPGDVFLDLQHWGKGLVWVNGKALGRFWRLGPQQTLFLPGCWVKKGKNEIIILDLLGPEKRTVSGLKQPILDMLRADKPATHRKAGETLNLQGETPVHSGSFAAGNGWKEVRFTAPSRGRYFCLEALSAQNGKDNAAVAEFYLLGADGNPLPRQHWKIVYADSEENSWGNFTADKIYDLQESTYWSTRQGDAYPHQVVIDLGEDCAVTGLRYLPRAEAGAPGTVKDFRAYLKADPFHIEKSEEK